MRIAIVNDVLLAVEALRRVITQDPGLEVAWVARDGAEAVEKCLKDRPDLILMDLVMPVMGGAEATRRIMRQSPCAILVVTSTVEGHSGMVFEAMGHGALDAVTTPILGLGGKLSGASELLAKIKLLGRLVKNAPARPEPEPGKPQASLGSGLKIAAIGSSTGGPSALAGLLAQLPANFAASLVIVQHVDEHFAHGLADWLSKQSRIPVRAAREGEDLKPGQAYLAATNDHLVLGADLRFHYVSEPKENPYRPSVDAFFSSLARYWPVRGAAALLTGMGRDGAQGLLALKNAGWHTVAQNEKTCVVYGMPKAAAELGAASEILPLELIAKALSDHL